MDLVDAYLFAECFYFCLSFWLRKVFFNHYNRVGVWVFGLGRRAEGEKRAKCKSTWSEPIFFAGFGFGIWCEITNWDGILDVISDTTFTYRPLYKMVWPKMLSCVVGFIVFTMIEFKSSGQMAFIKE